MEDQSCKTPRWRELKALLNNIKPGEFQAKTTESCEPVIIDVRTEAEFQQGHIAGAINIDFLSDDLWEQIELMDKSKTYLIYCRSGRRSIRVCTLMRNGGFDNAKVFNLDGGIISWTAMKQPLEPAY